MKVVRRHILFFIGGSICAQESRYRATAQGEVLWPSLASVVVSHGGVRNVHAYLVSMAVSFALQVP
jgi:hypothetical protein